VLDRSSTGWRAGMRRNPAGAVILKVAVFMLGALFVALGFVLVVLPGPLTIPPVLLGVYIWSLEFAWAERLRLRVSRSAREAWAQARRRPVSSALVTAGGVVLASLGVVLVRRYELLDRLTGLTG